MDQLQLRKYLKRSVATGISKTAIVASLSLFLIPLIINNIGIDKYGLIMLTFTFSGISSIVNLGISKSVTLLLGKADFLTQKNIIVSGGLYTNLTLGFLGGAIIYLLIVNNVPVFGSKFRDANYTSLILFIGYSALIINLLKGLASSILEAYYLMHYINIGHALSSVLLYGTIYLFSIFTTDLHILLWAPLIPMLLISLFYLLVVKIKTDLKLSLVSFKSIKKLINLSFKFFNLGIINSMIYPINKYLLIYISGSSSLIGVFDIGLKIASSANNLLNSLSGPLFGIFSNFKSKNNFRVYRIVVYTTSILFVSYLIGIVLFYFIGGHIASVLDAQHSRAITISTLILIFGICFSGVSEPVYRALIGTERLKEAFYLKVLIPTTNIFAFFCLFQLKPLYRISAALSSGVFIGSLILMIYYFIKSV